MEESAAAVGGREGEELLRRLVGSSFPFKNAYLFSGRRVPSKRQGRRREIDLIVCTLRAIHLIEVKNWSGSLKVHGGAWRQIRRSGEAVDHPDVVESNRLKREAVLEYLQGRGIALDDSYAREHIVAKVVFMNPNLELEPSIEARADVISRRELDGYLGRQKKTGLAERMFSSFIEFCLDSEKALGKRVENAESEEGALDRYQRIVSCLSEIDTWDRLHFLGGKVESGDALELKLGPRIYRRSEFSRMAERIPLRLQWTRGRLKGLLKALTGLGSLGSLYLGKTRVDLTPADTLIFHVVGEAEPTTFKLVEFDRIVLGSMT